MTHLETCPLLWAIPHSPGKCRAVGKQWVRRLGDGERVRSVLLGVISLAQYVMAAIRGWAVNRPIARLRRKAENDQLREHGVPERGDPRQGCPYGKNHSASWGARDRSVPMCFPVDSHRGGLAEAKDS